MRVLLVGDYAADPRLGSSKVYYKLTEELRALGHDCHILLADELGERPANPRMRWAAGPVLAARAVRRAFARHGHFDVIDAASAEGIWVGVQRRAGAYPGTALIARSHGIEHLNYERLLADHSHGLIHKPLHRRIAYPAVRLPQVAAAARLADRMIVLNRADQEFAIDAGWQRADRVDLVPHGVSERFLVSAPAPDAPRGRGILYCGTWTEMKGVPYLVLAMREVLSRNPDARLTVLGPGVPAEVVRNAFPESVRPSITVQDRVEENGVMRCFREHDIFVFPSTYEGFGMVLLEAMSQAMAVVATPVGCAPLLIQDGRSGLIVPPRDPAALVSAVDRLLGNPALRRTLGANAVLAATGLTWTRTARQTAETYRNAVHALRKA